MAETKKIFFTVLEAKKYKFKMLADLVCGEGLFPPLKIAVFSLYPHIVKIDREKVMSHVSSYKGTNPIYEGSSLMI